MTAIKSTSTVEGVLYVVLDADSNEVVLVNGQSRLTTPLTPQGPTTPTALLIMTGATVRLTQANAAGWPYSAGQSFIDADSRSVSFIAAPPVYNGGTLESANAGGVRMQFGGLFCDFTSQNLTDLGTPLAAFASGGAVT